MLPPQYTENENVQTTLPPLTVHEPQLHTDGNSDDEMILHRMSSTWNKENTNINDTHHRERQSCTQRYMVQYNRLQQELHAEMDDIDRRYQTVRSRLHTQRRHRVQEILCAAPDQQDDRVTSRSQSWFFSWLFPTLFFTSTNKCK